MAHYIIYKGANDQYRWREIDPASGTTDTVERDGTPNYSELFNTVEEAVADCQAKDAEAVIDDSRVNPQTNNGEVNIQ